MRQIELAVIGAGQRGRAYAEYALKYPHEARIVAVAEPDQARRERFQALHHLAPEQCFADWQELLAQSGAGRPADAVLICTQDRMHFAPAIAALRAGYHVLLEKPMSPDPRECIVMGESAETYQRVFVICHVLRYTPFFIAIKKLLDEGTIGRLISIQHNENVGYWHYGHSFVRGNWRNASESSPMILAKSCHDMDILLWLVGADCLTISSFGSLTHFRAENAPAGAPLRCLDGCPVSDTCPWYAPRLYLTEHTGWPTAAISVDTSLPARLKALQEGPYGRCVYHCDNDVVDHQVVNLEFANEVTAVFTMSAFTHEISRTIKLMGTKGEIRGAMEKNEIEVFDFVTGNRHLLTVNPAGSLGGYAGHGGGDFGLMKDFVRLVRGEGKQAGRTSAAISVQSHLMAFAAEQARLHKTVINLQEFSRQVREQ
ncbi:MAG: Gfo/Idh/MocA family oxidoreductase [Ktedonobacteraceae bacterium]|nr:Gfo/Idh/MocA family oxidoreductase [Ktedonobacteraceae bacterium]